MVNDLFSKFLADLPALETHRRIHHYTKVQTASTYSCMQRFSLSQRLINAGWVRGGARLCVLASGGGTEVTLGASVALLSSRRTQGRARPLGPLPSRCDSKPLGSTLWFFFFPSVCFDRINNSRNRTSLKRGIRWRQTKAVSRGISSPAAVNGGCWQMFKSITSSRTFMWNN